MLSHLPSSLIDVFDEWLSNYRTNGVFGHCFHSESSQCGGGSDVWTNTSDFSFPVNHRNELIITMSPPSPPPPPAPPPHSQPTHTPTRTHFMFVIYWSLAMEQIYACTSQAGMTEKKKTLQLSYFAKVPLNSKSCHPRNVILIPNLFLLKRSMYFSRQRWLREKMYHWKIITSTQVCQIAMNEQLTHVIKFLFSVCFPEQYHALLVSKADWRQADVRLKRKLLQNLAYSKSQWTFDFSLV